MRNAEEHKKFLAQVAELEKNSINYFDVEKEFFLIDSNNLSKVRPHLYGYSIQASGIYENDDLTSEAIAGLDGRGCYVYVDVKDGKITIKQDLNGSWGIYLFRHGDYFALSNSFFRLLDHVKDNYPLTVNRDYCNYIMLTVMSSHVYSETAVNEIELVDRSTILHIDKMNKNLEMESIDYKEHSVSPASKEGIDALDNWLEFWSSFFCALAQNTKFFEADLSGGFDSRISFVPILHSGINLDGMKINSSEGKLHTFVEDYDIASKIANHYGFKLNQPSPATQFLNYSLSDMFDLNLYVMQTFSNIPHFPMQRSIDKIYSVSGSGGELIRRYWHQAPENFIKNQIKLTKPYSRDLSSELSRSVENMISGCFKIICDKYHVKDDTSDNIPQYLYQETRCRHHFGRDLVINYFKNMLRLSPDIDPVLRTVQLNTPECRDYNLLVALIFARYAPDLLTFPFNGKRSIAPETIAYAQKINERFPCPVEKGKKHETGGGVFSSIAA